MIHGKIHVTIAINFISSKDVEEEHVMHSKGDYIKFAPYNDLNEVAEKHFKLLFSRYQCGLEASLRESNLIFKSVQVLHSECKFTNVF